jgi:pimeloyl-ACP methyl ester carboxylesterase
MRRAGFLAALLALAPCVSAGPASAAPTAELKPCRLRGLEHDALCGVLKRPLDPARPQGPQIDLHYAVLPALARNKRPDPVFFLAGGPGQSAIELAGLVSSEFARTLNRRDVVLIDQRGTGRSAPLRCEEADELMRPLSDLLDEAIQRQRVSACRTRLQALPYGDLRFFTTTLAMADLEAVRAALGAARINLVGASYGTRAALEYMRLYPAAVRRVVLDGTAPA